MSRTRRDKCIDCIRAGSEWPNNVYVSPNGKRSSYCKYHVNDRQMRSSRVKQARRLAEQGKFVLCAERYYDLEGDMMKWPLYLYMPVRVEIRRMLT